MKALCWHGKQDIRCDTVPDPTIEDGRDAIIRVTACAICGSDLHLYDGFMPGMESGDVMGHETMGEVVEVGRDNTKLKVGDRVVIPFTIICGACGQCKWGNYSLCERTNRNKELAGKVFGHTTAGLFGYTTSPAAIPAARPSTCACPSRTTTHIKVPDGIPDEKLLFSQRHLSDRLAGGGAMRHSADRHGRDLGLRACRANYDPQRRAARAPGGSSAIDRVPERLDMARSPAADSHQLRHGECLRNPEGNDSMAGGRTMHRRGRRGGSTPPASSTPCRPGEAGVDAGDRPAACPARGDLCAAARAAPSPSPACTRVPRQVPLRQVMNKGLTIKTGQTHVPALDTTTSCDRIEEGQIDPSFVITHKVGLEEGPAACTRRSATRRTAASR